MTGCNPDAAIIVGPNCDRADFGGAHRAVIVYIGKDTQRAFIPAPAKTRTELMMLRIIVRETKKLVDIILVFGMRRLVNSTAVEPDSELQFLCINLFVIIWVAFVFSLPDGITYKLIVAVAIAYQAVEGLPAGGECHQGKCE